MAKNKFSRIHVPEDPQDKPSWLAVGILLVVAPPVTTLVGMYLGYKRLRNESLKRRYKVYRRYANAIGNRASVSLRGLAAEVGLPVSNVVSDVQAMIDEGMIEGSPYIDRSHMMLYMDAIEGETIETEFVNPVVNVFVSPEDRARTVAEAKAAQARNSGQDRIEKPAPVEPKPAEAEAPRRKQAQPAPSTTDSENFEAKLREIRELNDAIKDPAVSERIDRIGELTASIFRVVREKPEHTEEVRKFMNYYLPTTLKLLKSYSLMEKQSYQGENIQSSRKKIEDVLNTLVRAFEQQQDRLFRTEAMDVETDISVLETMMASDGLVEPQGGLRVGGSKGK